MIHLHAAGVGGGRQGHQAANSNCGGGEALGAADAAVSFGQLRDPNQPSRSAPICQLKSHFAIDPATLRNEASVRSANALIYRVLITLLLR